MAPSKEMPSEKPPGLRLLGGFKSHASNQLLALILTFFAYTCFHMTRKIPSIVKGALDPNTKLGVSSWPRLHSSNATVSGWEPFNTPDGSSLLGDMDVAFLAMYSIGMFVAGHIGDSMNLRVFLTLGMFLTAALTSLLGVGYWLNIHNFYYFLVVMMIGGLFQSIGWPSVVAVVGNWFGKSKRGLIMGIWNSHTSIGNISGSLIGSYLLSYGWGWSFVVPSIIMAFFGVVVFLFLPDSPESMGIDIDEDEQKAVENHNINEPLLESKIVETVVEVEHKAVGFLEAWAIPGVAQYAFCLFFAKLVAYTFLYWLPFYISHTLIGNEYLSDSMAGSLSTIFDVGGVLGGVLAGYISDNLGTRATTTVSFMYLAIPALWFYRLYGSISILWNICLMFVAGLFVNGPYALITTAVSADLGTSLHGSHALATVTAIIDGTGSVGAAIGPLLTGYLSTKSWDAVFNMLMIAALAAGLLLSNLVLAELSGRKPATEQKGSSSEEAVMDRV